MRVRRVDDEGDYVFGGNQGDFWVNQPEAVAQEVMTRLRLFTGEWFADLGEGTDWATGVLGERTKATRDAVVRERVLGTQGVTTIDEYYSWTDPNTREWTAALTISTIFGPVSLGVARLAAGLPDGAVPPGTKPVIARQLGVADGAADGGGTRLTMQRANLMQRGTSDVSDFRIISIDAGSRW